MIPLRPRAVRSNDPSGYTTTVPGPEMFTVTEASVSRFVYREEKNPVNRIVSDPSAFAVVVGYSSLRTGSTRTGKPHTSDGSVNGPAWANCHLGPRAPAGCPNTPTRRAPATITIANRFMEQPPPRALAMFLSEGTLPSGRPVVEPTAGPVSRPTYTERG